MRTVLVCLATLMLCRVAFADDQAHSRTAQATAQTRVFRTPRDVEAFVQRYYLHPQPELVASLIDAMPMSGFFKPKPNATATSPFTSPFVGFFSEVFMAHPEQVPAWQVLIEKQDEDTRAALRQALALAKQGGVIVVHGNSAAINDLRWAAFFASGNPAYVKKLIDELRYWDERDDFNLFMAGAASKWSLASNAQSHDLVRSILQTAELGSDQRTRELITELLGTDPARIRREMMDIVEKQREAGRWTR